MEGVTTAGLLLLLLGLACAESKTWTKDTTLSQSETLNIIVNDLNNQSNEEYAFRVLDAHPRPDWDPTFSDPQLVIFTIRETECRKKNLSLEQCPFKDNGKEKTCWGHAKPVDEGLRVMVSCQSQKSGEHWRARRGLRKFLKKHFRWLFKKKQVKEKACYEDFLRWVCVPGARSAAHLPPAVPFPDQLWPSPINSQLRTWSLRSFLVFPSCRTAQEARTGMSFSQAFLHVPGPHPASMFFIITRVRIQGPGDITQVDLGLESPRVDHLDT